MRLFLVPALIMAIPTAALAQETPSTPAAAPASPVKEKKLCRSVEETGSRMPTRVCHTKAEWDQIDRAEVGGVAFWQQRQLNGARN